MATGCPWCAVAYSDWPDGIDPEQLCRAHLAEHEGLSVAELDRMEDVQGAEYREWVLGE